MNIQMIIAMNAGHKETSIYVSGDVITIDDTDYDLSPVPDGGEATAENSPFVGKITRKGGVINCAVRVTVGNTAILNQPTYSAHWLIEGASGDVEIPAIRKGVK